MIVLHAGCEPRSFTPPPLAAGHVWRMFVNTAAETPGDVYPALDGPPLGTGSFEMESHSLRCYVAE
jgi:glycogen operon protein